LTRLGDELGIVPVYLDQTGKERRYTTDATRVAILGAMGIDAVNYGPGETAQAHQAGESASVPALEDAYRKLRAFLTTAG